MKNGTGCDLYQSLTYEQDIYCCNYILGKNGVQTPDDLHRNVKLVRDLNIASLSCDWFFFLLACCSGIAWFSEGHDDQYRYFALCLTAFGTLLDICITFSIVGVISQNSLISEINELYDQHCYSPDLDSILFELASQFEAILFFDVTEGIIDIISLCILVCGKLMCHDSQGATGCTEGIHIFMFGVFDSAIITINVAVFVIPAYNQFKSFYEDDQYTCFEQNNLYLYQ